MATAVAELPLTGGTDIVATVSDNPGIVLLDRKKFDAFYARMKAETDKLVPDTATAKGRDEIRSVASRVRSSKAAIDKARLTLTKEWRDNVSRANEAGKVIETQLEALAVEVRAPLTEWEDAEKARVTECETTINRFVAAGTVTLDDTAATVRARGEEIWNTEIVAERFGSLFDHATTAKNHTISLLKTALTRLTQEEADRVELEKLRAQAAEREAKERAEQEAREAEERVAAEAKAAEERRIAAEKAEAERIVRIEREATERAQREAEASARAEKERRDREHADALAAERRRAEEAERAQKAEADRVAREEAARQQDAARVAAEQAKREANKAHRTRVKTAAKHAIMTCGASEETAQKIVLAIIAGEIPAVTLGF